ncbi:glycosyltransferase [Limnohabitans sp.]|uniref:glycosyltransferase n=1 Tax=Limnohabitans sp. TaxID=1907725 RepID=UPI0039BD8518
MTEPCRQLITVSVVSHGQGQLVAALLEDLACCQNVSAVVLTQNIPEDDIPYPASLQARLRVIRNEYPRGFAANHNQAFRFCETSLFAVLNPDIRLNGDPFPQLARALEMNSVGVVGPAVRNPSGDLEDSARTFPTPLRLLRKLMGLGDGRILTEGTTPLEVDWTAGMFLLFPASVYSQLEGFDEGFFLYYEDVDICTRLWRSGQRVILHPGVMVIHAAQRASRRRLRFMKWHLFSMFRYFVKHAWRLPR